MALNVGNIRIIGYSLAALYVLSVAAFLGYYQIPEFQLLSLTATFLFIMLVIASVATAQLLDWGRKAIILLNAILCVFIVGLYLIGYDLIPIAYVFLCLSAALFFSQTRIKILFKGNFNIDRKCILVIDDDPGLIKMVKPRLLANGFSVLTALNGEKGLQVAKKQLPDLILLDVILPGIKGRDVCTKLKEDPDTEKIPVLFLTAKDSPDDVEAEIAVGGISHITKPFKVQDLLAEIKKILGS